MREQYDTDLLRKLLEKLDAIGFTALGCEHESDDGETDAEPEGDSEASNKGLQLFETFYGCTFDTIIDSGDGFTPILMSMDRSTPANLALDTTVAFVNPHSRHKKEALLYMEQLADCLSSETLYAIDPSLNTPIRSGDYVQTKQEMAAALEAMKQVYEQAEADEKPDIAVQMREQEQDMAAYEQNSWDIAQANIDWYRANDRHIVMLTVDWLFSEEDGDAGSFVEQYLAGQMDAESMLANIDNTLSATRIVG